MDEALLAWIREHQTYALWVVPTLAFLEAAPGVGLLVSGVILLSVCTLLYSEGLATLPQMLPLAFMGAIVSDHLGYYLGRWAGPGLHASKFGIRHRERIDKAEGLVRRYGNFAIVIGRFFPAIRSIIPMLSGISGIARMQYTAYDLLACTLWTTGLGLLVTGLNQLF